MRSFQTIGLECARPGIDVRQATFRDEAASKVTGGAAFAMPEPSGPRKDGHCCATVARATKRDSVAQTVSRSTIGSFREYHMPRSVCDALARPARFSVKRRESGTNGRIALSGAGFRRLCYAAR